MTVSVCLMIRECRHAGTTSFLECRSPQARSTPRPMGLQAGGDPNAVYMLLQRTDYMLAELLYCGGEGCGCSRGHAYTYVSLEQQHTSCCSTVGWSSTLLSTVGHCDTQHLVCWQG